MDRKTFIQKTFSLVLIAIPSCALLNCSTSDDSGGDNNSGGNNNSTDCLENGATASSISSNHGHNLTVSSIDIQAGVDKVYGIQGSAGHTHEITVTSANFNTLQTNQQITVSSTNSDGHSHSVTISCA